VSSSGRCRLKDRRSDFAMACCRRCERCDLVETASAHAASSRAAAAEVDRCQSATKWWTSLSWISSVSRTRSLRGHKRPGQLRRIRTCWFDVKRLGRIAVLRSSTAISAELGHGSGHSPERRVSSVPIGNKANVFRRDEVASVPHPTPKKTQRQPREWTPCPHRDQGGCENGRTALSSVNRSRAPQGTD